MLALPLMQDAPFSLKTLARKVLFSFLRILRRGRQPFRVKLQIFFYSPLRFQDPQKAVY